MHFSSVVMREIRNGGKKLPQKISLVKKLVKHKSNIRENYCKKMRWKRLYPLMIHSTLKGERRNEEEKNLAQTSRKSSYSGKLENLEKYVLSKINQQFFQMIDDI